ncbi:MAG: aminotransferase class V-fold PLP-dependent enzyme [Fimbriimonadaceae bacterium]|nr:aminotransferase class V-fold PLP-dependent enzyme [Fimbriimonadaceae bacterium]
MRDRYFDNASTTPLDPGVWAEMEPWLKDEWGNPSSLHSVGRRAAAAVEVARMRLAELVDADDPAEIVFTSGATEANNWLAGGHPQPVFSPYEHSSVEAPFRAAGGRMAEAHGWTLASPAGPTSLLSVVLVNNETGAIPDLRAWFDPDLDPGAGADRLHRDLTQAAGKMPLHDHWYDFGSFSSHKLYGPKGIGAMHLRGGSAPAPMLKGGGQEMGLRSGTLNVPAIVGFGAAAAIALERMGEDRSLAADCREAVLEGLTSVSDLRLNAHTQNSPFILSVSFLGLEAQPLAEELDAQGFQVSTGAACSSRGTEPSLLLSRLGLSDDWNRGTVRISFGRFNTREAAERLGRCMAEAVDRLRRLGGR